MLKIRILGVFWAKNRWFLVSGNASRRRSKPVPGVRAYTQKLCICSESDPVQSPIQSPGAKNRQKMALFAIFGDFYRFSAIFAFGITYFFRK